MEWDLRSPELGRLVAKAEANIFSLCYLPGQQCILAGNMNGGLHWIFPQDTGRNKNIAHHRKGIYAIWPLGEHFLTAGGDGMLTRWSIAEARTLESIELSHESLRSIAYSEIRNELAIGASDGSIYLLEATTLAMKSTLRKAHEFSVFSVKYSPDGRWLISGGRDAHLKVWDCRADWACVSDQPAHWYAINSIAFEPAGTRFATASRDKTVKIWDAATFQLLKVLDPVRSQGHIRSVNTLFWSEFENYLVSGSDDRSLMVWGRITNYELGIRN